jgi:hypothetical protein
MEKVRIKLTKNSNGRGYCLYINGNEISVGVKEFSFRLVAHEAPTINLVMMGDIEISEELEAIVIANKENNSQNL